MIESPAVPERHLVVVGNGMVGQRLVEQVRQRDDDHRWRITVLSAESRQAYDRVSLSSYFEGADASSLNVVADGCYDHDRCVLHLDEAVVTVDREARSVTTALGRRIAYDALVIATGSYPFVPPVPGRDLAGCFVYRTLDDLDAIRAAAQGAVRRARGRPAGLVVGGGLLGLEAARALRLLGVSPHVVELAPRLMPQQVDAGGGEVLRQLVCELDVAVHLGTSVVSISESGRALLATLADGREFDVDLVVFSAGVRPQDTLAREAGLRIGDRGGIVVDERCRTRDRAVYAIGECACIGGQVYGLVAPGYAMAEAVARQLTGDPDASFTRADTATKLKLLGVDVASFGDALATTPGAFEVTLTNPVARTYAKLVVSPDAQVLLGGVLVGDASKYATLRPLVGRRLPGDPVAMIAPVAGAAPAGMLSDDSPVCSCNNITKGEICAAIRSAALTDVAGIKARTGAGTVCGSCVPLLPGLLADTGVDVRSGMCEHFTQTRAELFELVHAEKIATFTDLIERHGAGRGCDICKPAVASILASLGHGHILDGEQGALQDTNDHFLANLQKNGTYSVVPRIAGGEVTPAKLIVLGEVARDFGLYTKITGGQRIDLLGARVEQLPAIWRRLVDAGFESGHAYGKALRTVKSCVGSTWCRYGVQDSVSLAIELEMRYRGIRSPHKIKAGVSGCARECAEAQSKDIGVIATERGWNLFVGGNGGFRPRHAQLLCKDVDTEMLIRTIDRFIMFYVRTADRLQRTATWVQSLSAGGVDGLDYLRSVLLDDALGIAVELDEAIERHVTDYADEWAAVLEDPERLRRFVSFVNAPDTPDPSISFAIERGQPTPVPLQLAVPERVS